MIVTWCKVWMEMNKPFAVCRQNYGASSIFTRIWEFTHGWICMMPLNYLYLSDSKWQSCFISSHNSWNFHPSPLYHAKSSLRIVFHLSLHLSVTYLGTHITQTFSTSTHSLLCIHLLHQYPLWVTFLSHLLHLSAITMEFTQPSLSAVLTRCGLPMCSKLWMSPWPFSIDYCVLSNQKYCNQPFSISHGCFLLFHSHKSGIQSQHIAWDEHQAHLSSW